MTESKHDTTTFSESDAKRQIRKLTVENRRLCREIDNLKNELEEFKGKGVKSAKKNKYFSSLKHGADNEELFSKKNYFSFAFANIKHTSLFQTYRRIVNFVRRYTFITTSLKIVSVLFVFFETAALFLISTSAFVVSVPLTILSSQILAFFTVFTRKKHTKINHKLIEGKDVVIFFPSKSRAFDSGSFFSRFVTESASNEKTVAIIVSPYMIRSTGLNQSKKMYYVSRTDGKNILLIRRSYYFTLKKKCIDKASSSVTEIY